MEAKQWLTFNFPDNKTVLIEKADGKQNGPCKMLITNRELN